MIQQLMVWWVNSVSRLNDLPPLLFRLILAYGFYEPATRKISDIGSVAQWFGSMGFPFPTLNAYLAAGTETIGFVLLFIGLGTRLITIPLMVVMIVAITTVHWSHGFPASKNGFEIPLYYLLMLLSLLITGAGRFSLDAVIARRSRG